MERKTLREESIGRERREERNQPCDWWPYGDERTPPRVVTGRQMDGVAGKTNIEIVQGAFVSPPESMWV